MEYIIYLFVLFVMGSFLIKVSFYPIWAKAAIALVSAIFVWAITPWITEQPHDMMENVFALRPQLLNMSVCITLESAIMIGFCFSCITIYSKKNSRFSKAIHRWLFYYPGLMVGGVWCFLLSKILYAIPGIDFQLLPWMASGIVLLIVSCGTELIRWLLPADSLRLEFLFLVNLFIIILNIIITGY